MAGVDLGALAAWSLAALAVSASAGLCYREYRRRRGHEEAAD